MTGLPHGSNIARSNCLGFINFVFIVIADSEQQNDIRVEKILRKANKSVVQVDTYRIGQLNNKLCTRSII